MKNIPISTIIENFFDCVESNKIEPSNRLDIILALVHNIKLDDYTEEDIFQNKNLILNSLKKDFQGNLDKEQLYNEIILKELEIATLTVDKPNKVSAPKNIDLDYLDKLGLENV